MAPAQIVNSRNLLNAALLLAVVGIAAFLYFRPKPVEEPSFKVSTLQPEQISRIQVERPGSPPMILEKRGESWFLTAPLAARADVFKTRQLLDVATAASKQRLPATDLARFDLDKPVATLTLGTQVFRFGGINPLSQEQYLTTQDGVFPVPAYYGAALPARAEDLVSRFPLADDEIPVAFRLPAAELVRQADGRWELKPAKQGLSQDDLNRWAEQWKFSAEQAMPAANTAAAPETVTVTLKSGKTLAFRIVQREPQLVLLREDEGMQYQFSKEAGNKLLDPGA